MSISLTLRRWWWRARRFPGPPPGITQCDAETLFDEGLDLIAQDRWDAAIKIGRRLIAIRFTGGYEVIATAQNASGEYEAAITTLKTGLSQKPIWRLANLLGNFLSDLGRYEEALEAYRQSAGMFGDQPQVTALNRAVALSRCAHVEEARSIIATLIDRQDDDPDFNRKIRAVASDLGM